MVNCLNASYAGSCALRPHRSLRLRCVLLAPLCISRSQMIRLLPRKEITSRRTNPSLAQLCTFKGCAVPQLICHIPHSQPPTATDSRAKLKTNSTSCTVFCQVMGQPFAKTCAVHTCRIGTSSTTAIVTKTLILGEALRDPCLFRPFANLKCAGKLNTLDTKVCHAVCGASRIDVLWQ